MEYTEWVGNGKKEKIIFSTLNCSRKQSACHILCLRYYFKKLQIFLKNGIHSCFLIAISQRKSSSANLLCIVIMQYTVMISKLTIVCSLPFRHRKDYIVKPPSFTSLTQFSPRALPIFQKEKCERYCYWTLYLVYSDTPCAKYFTYILSNLVLTVFQCLQFSNDKTKPQ